MTNPSTLYSKIPKEVTEVAQKLSEIMWSGEVDNEFLMKHYFGKYWQEFKNFWTGEKIEWVTFALAPHNAMWFTQFVFYKYPNVMAQVVKDIEEGGW